MYPVDDPHSQANVRIRWYNENKIDLLLSPLYHEVQSWRKKLNGELLFLPHSVDIETFYPREKTIDASFLGETSKVSYPFRYKIAEYLSTSKEIKGYYHKRPGYGIYGRTIGEQLLKNYCSVLGNSKLFVFDVGIFKRPYLKFLEALASKALPLAPIPYDIKKYHLEPDLDFGIIDENNFKDKIRYYIDNEKERLEMTEHGYQKVLKYHSMDIRVKEFLKIVEERI